MKSIIEYEVIQDGQPLLRRARIVKGGFHPELGRIYACVSPFGHVFELTAREIKRFIKKERHLWTNKSC